MDQHTPNRLNVAYSTTRYRYFGPLGSPRISTCVGVSTKVARLRGLEPKTPKSK